MVDALVYDEERGVIRVRYQLRDNSKKEIWASPVGCQMYVTPEPPADTPAYKARKK